MTIRHTEYDLALRDHDMLPVIAYGCAGSSKTYSAVKFAIEWLKTKNRQVIITRPNVSFAKELGFLPGNEREKMVPWIRPIEQCFVKQGVSKASLEAMERSGSLTYIPLEYVQGLTFDNTLLICDEVENMTLVQLKALLTRQGKWSKTVLCGDITQTSPYFRNSGLAELLQMVRATDIPVHTIEFMPEDIVRSKQCRAWIEAFDDWDIIKRTIV